MNLHPDTQIPPPMLRTIGSWMVRVVNTYKISDQSMPDESGLLLLRALLGDGITFDILRNLRGNAVLDELRSELKIKLPRNMEDVFTAFAQAWSPSTPSCPDCKVLAIRPRADRTSVEGLPEGSVCPWCTKGTVRTAEFRGSLQSWVTGAKLPLDTEFDDVTVPGCRLPLQEGALRALTSADLLRSLDRQEVPVQSWLRYLLLAGHQVFGLSRAHLPILASLSNDFVLQYGAHVMEAQILCAKRETERMTANRALEVHYKTQILTTSVDGELLSEKSVHDLLCRLSSPQFEQFLFMAKVPVEYLASSSAPQVLRVNNVMGLVRSGTLRLDNLYRTARSVLAARG